MALNWNQGWRLARFIDVSRPYARRNNYGQEIEHLNDRQALLLALARNFASIKSRKHQEALCHLARVLHDIETKTETSPLRARQLLDWMLPLAQGQEIVGDLEELYFDRVLPRDGKKWADRWYWWMAARAILPVWKRIIWNQAKGIWIVAVIGGAVVWVWEKIGS